MASRNTHTVIVGSFAAAEQPGITAWTWDAATASLEPLGAMSGIPNPAYLARHPRMPRLYAAEESAPGGVWALRADDVSRIEAINRQPSGGDHPCHLALDPSGRWLVASNYSSGSVAVYPVGDDGALGEMTDLVQHHGSGPNRQRQEGPHAHSATWALDGSCFVVADLGVDRLIVYALEAASGRLEARSETATPPGSGPRHAVFDPSGRRLFVANELGCSAGAYDFDPALRSLSVLEIVSTLPSGAAESYVADIHLAGRRLLVSNRGHNSLAVFDVRPDGELVRSTVASCGGNWPRNFAVAPEGGHLLVANERSGEVVVLPFGDGPEPVGAPVARVAVPGASCILWWQHG